MGSRKWRFIAAILGILASGAGLAGVFIDPLAQKEEEDEFYENFKAKFKADLETDILKGDK